MKLCTFVYDLRWVGGSHVAEEPCEHSRVTVCPIRTKPSQVRPPVPGKSWDYVVYLEDAVSQYPMELFQHGVLSADAHRLLADLVQDGVRASEEGGADTRIRRLRRRRGLRAKRMLVRWNLRLVRKFVNGPAGVSEEDLFSMGVEGLVHAAEKFDPDKGNFSTYAVWWIRQAVRRGLDTESTLVRVPVHLIEEMRGLRRRFAEEGTPWWGRVETLPSRLLGEMDRDRFCKARGALAQHESLGDATTPDAGDWWPEVPDPVDWIGDADDRLHYRGLWEALEQVLASRGGPWRRDLQIMRMRFGADECEVMTLEEIGRRVGVTRERIRQVVRSIVEDEQVRRALSPWRFH